MVDAQSLHVAFPLFLIVLAGYFVWQLRARTSTYVFKASVPARFIPVVGLPSGGMSGLFTVGGGLIAVPAFSLFSE